MSKINENILTPKLRFPEFVNDGEWEEKKLKDVCEINPKISQLPDEFIYIDLESVDKGKLLQKKFIKRDKAPSRAQRFLEDNDVVFQTVRPYQKNNYYFKKNDHYDYVASTGYAQLRAFESSMFLFQLIHTDRFVSKVLNKCSGSNYPAINSSDLSFIPIEIPAKPEEQNKIASCLSSLDELILAESQKLEVLIDHKKGLLQNLLPQEGETIPKFRFKEFEDSGDWEEKSLGRMYSFITTNSFSRDNLNYNNGKVKNIHYGDIHTKFSTHFDIRKEIVPFINFEIQIDKIKPECYCIEGDIIFADASEDLQDVGKSIEIIFLNGEKLLSGMHTLMARQKEPNLIVGFGGHLFKSNVIRSQIQKEAQGTKVLGISVNRLSNIKIRFPKNKQEQQKIASCLSSLDELINTQRSKIEALKLHKKGLLQGLFPDVKKEHDLPQ